MDKGPRVKKGSAPLAPGDEGFDARSIRLERGVSLERAAVYAGVSYPTARAYEANRFAVTPPKRSLLDRYYAQLAATPPRAA